MPHPLSTSDPQASLYSLHLDQVAEGKDDRGAHPGHGTGVAHAQVAEPDGQGEGGYGPRDELGDRADHRNGSAAQPLAAGAEEEDHAQRDEKHICSISARVIKSSAVAVVIDIIKTPSYHLLFCSLKRAFNFFLRFFLKELE